MNNAKIVDDYNDTDEAERIQRSLASAKSMAAIKRSELESIRGLKRSGDFKLFRKLVIEPRIKKLNEQLRNDVLPQKFYRVQGAIGELEKYFDLAELEKDAQAEFLRYDQSAKLSK